MQNGRILLVQSWSSSLHSIPSPTALGEIRCYPLIVLPDPQPLQIVLVTGLSSPNLHVIYSVASSKSINQLHLSASNADRIEQTFPSWYHCDTPLTGLYHRTHISVPCQKWVESVLRNRTQVYCGLSVIAVIEAVDMHSITPAAHLCLNLSLAFVARRCCCFLVREYLATTPLRMIFAPQACSGDGLIKYPYTTPSKVIGQSGFCWSQCFRFGRGWCQPIHIRRTHTKRKVPKIYWKHSGKSNHGVEP